MKRTQLLLTAILALAVLSGCHADKISEDYPSLGRENADDKILVAGELSDFRYDVIKSVADASGDYFFEVTDFKGAKDRDLNSYSAVIVVDQLEAWMLLNGKAKRLMGRIDKDRVIPFITAGDTEWEWKDKKRGIEAVTGPSEEPRKEGMVEEITARLEAIVGE